jgi:alpha/beta superfamily hydrolase
MTEVHFNGPEGRIEGRYRRGKEPSSPIVILLHPHPQYGGTMNHKVIYTAYQTFVHMGYSVLRFNFRGIGKSLGEFEGTTAELSDAAAALDWMQLHNPEAKACWVVGLDFGAWTGMQLLMRRPEIDGFIAMGLPIGGQKDFSFLAPCPASGMIVQGGQDEFYDEHVVASLAKKLNNQKNISVEYEMFPEADHFFNNHLAQLSRSIAKYVLTSGVKKKKVDPRRKRAKSAAKKEAESKSAK